MMCESVTNLFDHCVIQESISTISESGAVSCGVDWNALLAGFGDCGSLLAGLGAMGTLLYARHTLNYWKKQEHERYDINLEKDSLVGMNKALCNLQCRGSYVINCIANLVSEDVFESAIRDFEKARSEYLYHHGGLTLPNNNAKITDSRIVTLGADFLNYFRKTYIMMIENQLDEETTQQNSDEETTQKRYEIERAFNREVSHFNAELQREYERIARLYEETKKRA